MCGRFALTSAPAVLQQIFGYAEQPNFPPRYNIAPTQPVAVVSCEPGGRHFQLMRWGVIPAWVKDPKTFSLVINARSETVLEKPAFRNAIRRRRCLVPAEEGENDRSQQRQESDDAEERVAEDHPSSPPAAMAQVRSAAMPISIAKA